MWIDLLVASYVGAAFFGWGLDVGSGVLDAWEVGLGADGGALDARRIALDAESFMCLLLSTVAIQKNKKAVPLSKCSTPETAVLLLEPSSPKAEEASAPSTETRPLSRVYRRAHYGFRCLSKIVPRRDNRMLPIDVDNRMNIRLFNWEELVIEATLCRANDWLQLAHWHHPVSSTKSSALSSTMSSTVSVLHHHLHSPPSTYYM